MLEMTQYDNPKEIIENSSLCILLYGSKTCAPCHAIRQRIDEWIKEYTQAVSYYIDIEKLSVFSAQSGIFSTPSVRVFMEGIPVIEKSGYFSLEEIFINIRRLCDLRDQP